MPPVFANVGTVLRTTVIGLPDAPITSQYVANLPYASISAKIGKGQRSLLVLARYDGPDLHWVSTDHVVFVTRNGRLIRLIGAGADLKDTTRLADDPIASGSNQFAGTHVRDVDLEPDKRYGVTLESTYTMRGRETIAILDRSHDTLHVREHATASSLRWVFENDFWIDSQTGFVWKSVQYFARDLPPAEIAVLKPAA